MRESRPRQKLFRPFKLPDTSKLTPDDVAFYRQSVNLVILTKYGRGIYIRHGNQDRCSSFFATLGTIVNKLELSFGRAVQGQEKEAELKCIRQGKLNLFVLRRLNYMYVGWSKDATNEILLYSMMEFVHHQLMSCLTGKVNEILDNNQTYDPSVNFGNTKTEHLLLHYAFASGIHSLPIQFNAIPTMHLPQTVRTTLLSLFKEEKIEGLQISILMTLNEVIAIHKQKGIDLKVYDIFLFINLIQSQLSLFKSEIWYPICLPGVLFQSRLFCYINFITEEVIHIMVSDEADIFPQLSMASKRLKAKCTELNLFERISLSSRMEIINDPSLDKPLSLKHFALRYTSSDQNILPQMVMSSYNYFGDNSPEFGDYLQIYGELHGQLVTRRQGKKERIHIQQFVRNIGGYWEQGNICVFFVASELCDYEQARAIISGLMRYSRQEENNLWIQKVS